MAIFIAIFVITYSKEIKVNFNKNFKLIVHMRITISALVLLFIGSTLSHAQQPSVSLATFKENVSTQAKTLNTLEADFVQVKYLEVLDEKVVSEGKIYYKNIDKLRVSYTKPSPYLVVMNGRKVKIESEGKKSTYGLDASKEMGSLNEVLTACMSGKIGLLEKNHTLTLNQDDKAYCLIVKNQSADKKQQGEVRIFFDKNDYSTSRFIIKEATGDYTEYTLTNRKKNVPLADGIFSLL